ASRASMRSFYKGARICQDRLARKGAYFFSPRKSLIVETECLMFTTMVRRGRSPRGNQNPRRRCRPSRLLPPPQLFQESLEILASSQGIELLGGLKCAHIEEPLPFSLLQKIHSSVVEAVNHLHAPLI